MPTASAPPSAPLHVRLMARHPLEKERDRAAAARGLDEAASAYAAAGSYNGADGPWWRVWRALERARGHRLREAVATLKPEGRRWFAKWSFARGRLREGAFAYSLYVKDPGGAGPFDPENARYLEVLAARRGPAEIARVGRALLAKTPASSPLLRRAILQALEASGDRAAILAFAPRPDAAALHDGDAWARYAIAQQAHGDPAAARFALGLCAKLGVGSRRDRGLVDDLCAAMGLSREAWSALCAPWAPPDGDVAERWEANLGLRMVPSKDASPHVYGGDAVPMPDCPGCGHRMHALYTIDVPSVPALAALLPGWKRLPLILCPDCSVQLFRRDYAIDRETGAISLLAVAAEPKHVREFGRGTGRRMAPIPAQFATLVPAEQKERGSDRTQLAGEPDWVQDFERAFCPKCHEEMRFVAALGSDWKSGFEPAIAVNNGSGYQYHFACAPCGTLGVFGQNT